MTEDIEQARCGPEVIVLDAEGHEHRFTLVNTSKGLVLVTTSTIVGLAHGSDQLPQLIHVAPISVVESGIAYGEGGDA